MRTNYIVSTVTPVYTASDDSLKKSTPPSAAQQESYTPLLRNKRVVIVEDEGITQLQLRKICMLAGMNVVGMAADGQQGVQEVMQSRPDIVLMDIKMPGMNGLDAAEIILQEYSTCIIMLTAYDAEDHRATAAMLGTSGYILKPVTSGYLTPLIEDAYKLFASKAQ
jgi:AmiR/NasT family two-component response regulator